MPSDRRAYLLRADGPSVLGALRAEVAQGKAFGVAAAGATVRSAVIDGDRFVELVVPWSSAEALDRALPGSGSGWTVLELRALEPGQDPCEPDDRAARRRYRMRDAT